MDEKNEHAEDEFDELDDFTPSYEPVDPARYQSYGCFRCGDCCSLWVLVNYEECDRITAYTGKAQNEFATVYWDRTVAPEECLVLRQKDGACVFLRSKQDKREKYCGIYEVRPRVCSDYVPSLTRKECRGGLLKCWGLSSTPTGRLAGNEDKIKAFKEYLGKMVLGDGKGEKKSQP